MERLAAIDRLFSADGRGNEWTQLEVSRAYRFMGDQHAALRVVEPLAKSTSNPNTFRHFVRLLRLTGQPREALEQLDQAARDQARTPLRNDLGLLVERARVHATLQEWQSCEAAIDEGYRRLRGVAADQRGSLVYAALMKGFLLERRGATVPAQGVWREAFRAFQGGLGKTSEANADILHILILGSLTGELTAADTQAFFSRTVVGAGDNNAVRLAQSLTDQQTLQTCLQRMWRTELGRRYAEAYAYESLTMQERIKTPAVLAIVEYFREAGSNGDLSEEQETQLFELMSRLFDAMFVEGKISVAQAAQLRSAGKGQRTSWVGTGWRRRSTCRCEPGLPTSSAIASCV